MKKYVIGLIIGIISVSIAIIVLWIYMEQNRFLEDEGVDITEEQILLNRTIQEVKNDGEFYRVKSCIDYYALIVNEINTIEEGQLQDIDFVYDPKISMLDLLAEEYKTEFNITYDKVIEKYINGQKATRVTLLNVYKVYNNINITTYFAYGMMRDEIDNQVEGFSIMVAIDETNDTFAIYPAEYMQKHALDNMQLGQELILTEIEKIEPNNNNTSKYAYIKTEQAIQHCFSGFQELALYSTKTAYDMLQEEYREKRFPTFEEFDSYIQKNRLKFAYWTLDSYSVEINGDTTQYICIDQNDNYYIFNEYGAMDFDVQLDIYTLDTTEFLTKYNAGNYQERVILNLNKVQEAVNQGDYRYIYNHLDETFKQNNFATFEVFSAYMETRYFVHNIFSFDSYQEVGDVASCTVNITNGENTAESKQQNFIMQLGEGTDFVMSFQV